MATNYVPFQGGTGAQDSTYGPSGGYLLPPEQGEILVNGILVETGGLQLAGDARATSARKTNFPIWLGQPDAFFVGEGAQKSVTGASFSQTSLNIKKVATIVVFTDEMIEDLQNGDLNVLVDAGVRQAISKVVDQNVGGLGAASGAAFASNFDSTLVGLTPATGNATVNIATADTVTNVDDRLQRAISSALNTLETNGYGDPNNIGVLLGFGWQQTLRDARDGFGRPMYDGGSFAGQSIDALYGLDRAHSTALSNAGTAQLAVSSYSAPTVTVSSTAGLVIGAPIVTTSTQAVVGYVKAIINGTTFTASDASGTNLTGSTISSSSSILSPQAVLVHKPNLHVRVRKDVSLATSNEASLVLPGNGPPASEGGGSNQTLSLFQNNLFAARYEMRLGFLIHDAARSVVPIWG